MKKNKRFFAAALMLMLLLAIAPGACADTIYPAPAPVPAGSELYYQIATVSPDAQVYMLDDSFPEGVTLYAETGLEGMNIFLRGVPLYAGNYNCVFYVGENSLFCPLTVEAASPFILSTSSDVSCSLNEPVQLEVSAFVQDGGTLSYQWYLGQPGSGAPIVGNSPMLSVGTATPGTSYYYCIVTNNNNGCSASATSPVIAVTVGDSRSTSWVSIFSEPYKTNYMVGETLDTTGLQLNIGYSDGSSEVISSGFYVDAVQLSTPGVQAVRVYYEGSSCSFNITVGEQAELITGIGVLTLPAKTRYTVGEALDTTGLSIRAYTNSGTGYRDISWDSLICSPSLLNTLGEQEILVVYGDKSCTFTVSVEEAEHPVSLMVQTMPNKISYSVGQTLDITGLVLKQISSRQNAQLIYSGFSCTPTLLNTPGRQQITVTYGNLSTSFTVTVTSATPSATVSPSTYASPLPSSVPTSVPTMAPTAVPSPLPSVSPTATTRTNARSGHQSNLGRSLIGVIVISALLALAVLGAYVFVMNQGGLEGAEARIRELLNRGKDKSGRGRGGKH